MSFSSKNKLRLSTFLNVILLLISVLISMYYWFNSELVSMKNLPIGLIFLIIIFVLLDWIKIRFISNKMHWWGYISYLGFTCLLYPILLGNSSSDLDTLNSITDVGVLFFFISIGIDLVVMNQKKETNI